MTTRTVSPPLEAAELFLSDLAGAPVRALLEDWRWLLGERNLRPLCLTAFGDWFLEDAESGEVLFLDVGRGRLEVAAPSYAAWRVLVCEDAGKRQAWLRERQFVLLRASGLQLGPGECYSWNQAPCQGGAATLDNFDVCPLRFHQRYHARFTRRVLERTGGLRSRSASRERSAHAAAATPRKATAPLRSGRLSA